VNVAVALLEWIAHIGVAVVQVLSWLGLGTLLLRRAGTGMPAVDLVNRLGAGAVAFALLTFALGLLGLLYPVIIDVATIAAAVAGVLALVGARRVVQLPRLRALPRWQLAMIGALAATALLALVAAGAPVTGYDALLYHVSVPALYEREHRFFEVPWSWSSYQPFSVEMLITDGLLLWNPVQGSFATLALVGCATATVAVGAAMIGRATLGLLAAALFLCQPLVAWEGTAALVECGIAFVFALAALNVLVWARTRATATLVLAGLFAGAGAGMKYVGLFGVVAGGVAVVLAAERGRHIRSVAAFGVSAVVVALPWYAKNWIYTGNPVFPFVFGGASESTRSGITETLRDFGYGHSPIDALLLPFRLIARSDAFDGSDWLSPLLLVFPPLALLTRRPRRGVWIALAACGVYVACWFATSQQARFLIPMLPVLVVLSALGIEAVVRAGRTGRLVGSTALAGALALELAIFAFYCAQFFPVVAGAETKEHFLSERTAFYDGVAWLNRHAGQSDGVLIDFPSPYLDSPYVVWTPLVLPSDASPGTIRRFVRDRRIRYVAVLTASKPGRSKAMAAMGARPVERLDVHTAFLGLRRWGGIPTQLHIYRLPGP
jgi:hypothetical protein